MDCQDKQGWNISRIPFDYTDLELNEFLLSLFIDKQGTIWV